MTCHAVIQHICFISHSVNYVCSVEQDTCQLSLLPCATDVHVKVEISFVGASNSAFGLQPSNVVSLLMTPLPEKNSLSPELSHTLHLFSLL